ncbi:unnamed protein product [Gongylonema pulchrum]|uniref:BAT2_N domain-containing protein n=1 Tax=Gongylonema pulchrum TaxID=637853 RepID=A0A183DHE2_9BILA|nr:unnamed protein product [Gongylonema pulchrum]
MLRAKALSPSKQSVTENEREAIWIEGAEPGRASSPPGISPTGYSYQSSAAYESDVPEKGEQWSTQYSYGGNYKHSQGQHWGTGHTNHYTTDDTGPAVDSDITNPGVYSPPVQVQEQLKNQAQQPSYIITNTESVPESEITNPETYGPIVQQVQEQSKSQAQQPARSYGTEEGWANVPKAFVYDEQGSNQTTQRTTPKLGFYGNEVKSWPSWPARNISWPNWVPIKGDRYEKQPAPWWEKGSQQEQRAPVFSWTSSDGKKGKRNEKPYWSGSVGWTGDLGGFDEVPLPPWSPKYYSDN